MRKKHHEMCRCNSCKAFKNLKQLIEFLSKDELYKDQLSHCIFPYGDETSHDVKSLDACLSLGGATIIYWDAKYNLPSTTG